MRTFGSAALASHGLLGVGVAHPWRISGGIETDAAPLAHSRLLILATFVAYAVDRFGNIIQRGTCPIVATASARRPGVLPLSCPPAVAVVAMGCLPRTDCIDALTRIIHEDLSAGVGVMAGMSGSPASSAAVDARIAAGHTSSAPSTRVAADEEGADAFPAAPAAFATACSPSMPFTGS